MTGPALSLNGLALDALASCKRLALLWVDMALLWKQCALLPTLMDDLSSTSPLNRPRRLAMWCCPVKWSEGSAQLICESKPMTTSSW